MVKRNVPWAAEIAPGALVHPLSGALPIAFDPRYPGVSDREAGESADENRPDACPSCTRIRSLKSATEFRDATLPPDGGRLLTAPGMAVLLGIDPACRSSCGFVLFDETGKEAA